MQGCKILSAVHVQNLHSVQSIAVSFLFLDHENHRRYLIISTAADGRPGSDAGLSSN